MWPVAIWAQASVPHFRKWGFPLLPSRSSPFAAMDPTVDDIKEFKGIYDVYAWAGIDGDFRVAVGTALGNPVTARDVAQVTRTEYDDALRGMTLPSGGEGSSGTPLTLVQRSRLGVLQCHEAVGRHPCHSRGGPDSRVGNRDSAPTRQADEAIELSGSVRGCRAGRPLPGVVPPALRQVR